MKAGNLPERVSLEFHYISATLPPFRQESSEKRIIFRPHQSKSLNGYDHNYEPMDVGGEVIELNCPCNTTDGTSNFMTLINERGLKNTLLWIDPRFIPLECITSIVYCWNNSKITYDNISLGIVISQKTASLKSSQYHLWKPHISGSIDKKPPQNSVWYPSLNRENSFLTEAAKYLDPYDVYPLLDFSTSIIQPGETHLTDHSLLLEETRTRTRHFLMLNSKHPEKSFRDFYNTLIAMPRTGFTSIHPVITPGGHSINYFVTILAGALSDSYFLSPKSEIPMNSYDDPQGFVIIRKCI